MIKTKAYGLVSTITLAGALGLMTIPSVEAAEIKTGLQTTPIRRAASDSLSDEQKSHVIPGQITDVPMSWINSETGNVEWITDFVLVYEKTGKCSAIPSDEIQIPETPSSDTPVPPSSDTPETPSSDTPVPPSSDTPETPSSDTPVPPSSGTPGTPGSDTPKTPSSLAPSSPIQKVIQKVLPNTGVKQATTLIVVGVGLATFAGYLMFRNKRTGKTVAVALLVATGAGFSSAALAESVGFLDIVQQIEIKLDERFQHTAEESECWKYVGYIPVIAEESVKESNKTGNVNVKYVDTEGKEIKDLYNLVVEGKVSTTKTTTTTVDGVSSSTEETVASGLTYDATTQKPTTITFDGKVYEFVQVKDGDVEQGLVTEGTTTVTYIYRHAPQITEAVTETTKTGNVNVKYVDTEGNEIKDLYKLVENGLVSTTKTTITTVDGVPSSKEETVASGLTYDATTQKPTTITFDGKVYEFVQVKDGDVEQGLVTEGTTTVTYIYRHVPQITEAVTETTTTGNVNVKYVDTEGKEIKDLYKLVENGLVSTTRTTTTTVDGVPSSKEETVASGLTYDATTQKPTTITFDGKVYEFVQVKAGDVEQGLVTEGTTTITYIYKVAPNTTETISTPITGTVKTRYVDADTGEEIVSGSTIVDNGVVANKVTTIVRNAAGEVVSETTERVPTGLTYDTTADKTAKNAEIALIRLPVLEMIDHNGNLVTPDADGYVTVTETKTWGESQITTSDYQTVYDFVEYHYKNNMNLTKFSIKSLVITPEGDRYSATAVVEYTYYIGNKTVGYTFVSVDEAEEGAVEEGTKTITYKYRRQAYEAEATTAIAMTIQPAEMTTSLPD
ncbi:MucBP domain-containing protein [Streptococcus iners]|uniref:MucBP domain-containing protein n=1 Tax=Streptococcus iners TaxID=3028084 RepID=UPI002006007D|nr:LPXTG cell wall anchor domain-containing protein [Streptococcus suis]